MTYPMIVEGIFIASAAFGLLKLIEQQRRKLKRLQRGVRLVNYIVDRANEREATARIVIQEAQRRTRSA